MNEGGPACVLIGAHGREHGGDGGADILAHDDGNGTAISHCASGGQGLKDSHRSGGGLDDGSEDSSGQHAQNGVGEHQQDVGKGGHIGQAGHRAGHGFHAEHQGGKAQQNGTDVLFFAVVQKDVEHHADDGQNGRERGRLKQLNDAVPLQASQRDEPGGDGGTHVGAHDDTHRLSQLHHAGVDEAHHHHCGGGGGLDDRGDHHAQEKALNRAGGQTFQNRFEFASGGPFQALAHDGHPEQEQGQPTQHGQKIKDIHKILLPHIHPQRGCLSLSNKAIISKIHVKHNHL